MNSGIYFKINDPVLSTVPANYLLIVVLQDNWSTSVGSVSRRSSVSVNSYDTTDLLSPGKGRNKKIYEEYFPELFTY